MSEPAAVAFVSQLSTGGPRIPRAWPHMWSALGLVARLSRGPYLPSQRANRDLDYSRLICDEAANRVMAEVPAR